METVIIAIVAFATSVLTFLSGFGLGTILLPLFVLFSPADLTVAKLVAVMLIVISIGLGLGFI